MYDKNPHTNVWKRHAYKHAYKCMTKTRIQTRIQMYDKNTHTNVWQKHAYKHAYKSMTKTRIQNRIQMYDKNAYKIAYKCMKKNRHTNVWKKTVIQMYEKNILIYWSGGQPITAPREYGVFVCMFSSYICITKSCFQNRIHDNVWQKQAYKCMTKTRIQMYEKNRHTNVWKKFTHILERWAANYSAQGAWGYCAFP